MENRQGPVTESPKTPTATKTKAGFRARPEDEENCEPGNNKRKKVGISKNMTPEEEEDKNRMEAEPEEDKGEDLEGNLAKRNG